MKTSVIFLLLWVLVILGCSVHPPDIRVTGEKTALENQIIGTYDEINNDTWMVTATRATSQQKVTISDEKKRVLQAVQNRKFNKDDVDEYKRKGILGENNRGFLEVIKPELLEQDNVLKQRVTVLVEEENQDRKIIYERVIELNDAAAAEGIEKVSSIFGKLNRDNAEPGEWVQLPDGQWIQKSKE